LAVFFACLTRPPVKSKSVCKFATAAGRG